MNENNLYIKGEFTQEELRILRGCLLTTKETFKCVPFKNKDIKNKIMQINEILEKFVEGS